MANKIKTIRVKNLKVKIVISADPAWIMRKLISLTEASVGQDQIRTCVLPISRKAVVLPIFDVDNKRQRDSRIVSQSVQVAQYLCEVTNCGTIIPFGWARGLNGTFAAYVAEANWRIHDAINDKKTSTNKNHTWKTSPIA